ncbi:MFS transporter [Bifidobacterium sp.]|uniref:MFS transporter n=1 Tax=Bifidobacterium sp. TaxID=41200 RepID=UPI0025BB5F1B|nr:MFS transporter [Bifidobacterium sp.]MCH4210135.1 MFS transporter [Bifidobacterium sp.]MCI1225633.1 MFS transporter [Bifidobacterium sp.]
MPKLRLDASARRSFLLIMIVLFSYSLGGNAVETYFTLYATHDLHMQAAAAGGALTFYAGGAILFAIVAGVIGEHLGRRPTMSIGLICGVLAFIPMPWIGRAGLIIPLALLFGIAWTLVFVNALPWIAELGGTERNGTMTAYYYLATSGGAAISPTLYGLVQQWTGEYRWMFLYAAVFFIAALACMPFIKHGEAPRQQ